MYIVIGGVNSTCQKALHVRHLEEIKLGDGQPDAVFDMVDSSSLDAVFWRVLAHPKSRSDRIGQCIAPHHTHINSMYTYAIQ